MEVAKNIKICTWEGLMKEWKLENNKRKLNFEDEQSNNEKRLKRMKIKRRTKMENGYVFLWKKKSEPEKVKNGT